MASTKSFDKLQGSLQSVVSTNGPTIPGVPPIKACIFDMDGLLLDTEEILSFIINKILKEYGKPDVPWRIKAQLQGRPLQESTRILLQWAGIPTSQTEEYLTKLRELQSVHFPETRPLPGVETLLKTLKATTDPQIRLAVATSSATEPYELKTANNKDLFALFDPECIVKGDDPRLGKGRGKPAPDIYLLALRTINDGLKREGRPEIKPAECLVFEDAVPGVEAGRRAGMQVVWCPQPGLLAEFEGREKQVLAGQMGEHEDESGLEKPGAVDNGYGRLFSTLEDFPYESYGISVNNFKSM